MRRPLPYVYGLFFAQTFSFVAIVPLLSLITDRYELIAQTVGDRWTYAGLAALVAALAVVLLATGRERAGAAAAPAV